MAKGIDDLVFPGIPPEISDAAMYPFVVHMGRIAAEAALKVRKVELPTQAACEEIAAYVVRMLQRVQSPIEAPMAVELAFINLNPSFVKAYLQYGADVSTRTVPQVEVAGYRVDFLLTFYSDDGERQLAIECDGHDYHERTKEQAARDRKRDRVLLTAGIPTLRFTGSEIWRDPIDCGDQIGAYLAAWVAEIASRKARK